MKDKRSEANDEAKMGGDSIRSPGPEQIGSAYLSSRSDLGAAQPAGWILYLRGLLARVVAERERLSADAARALDATVESLQSSLPHLRRVSDVPPPVPARATESFSHILGRDPHIVLVGSTARELEAVFSLLRESGHGFRLTLVRDARGARRALERQAFDLVIYEYAVRDLAEFEEFGELHQQPNCPPVIFVAGDGSEELAAAAFKAGVYDYVPRRELSPHVLQRTIGQALRRLRLERELEAANQRLGELVNRDPLTGLFNRRYFEGRLAVEFARAERFGHPLGLILLDIDHFKSINDEHGHPAGDRVLIATARTMLAMARQIDLVARLGGEEFALLLPNTRPAGAAAMAERIVARVRAQQVPLGGVDIQITLSAGVASYPDCTADTRMQLFECADRALYRAKRAGRDRVARFVAE